MYECMNEKRISSPKDLEAPEFAEGLELYGATAEREVCELSQSVQPSPSAGYTTRSRGEMDEAPELSARTASCTRVAVSPVNVGHPESSLAVEWCPYCSILKKAGSAPAGLIDRNQL